MVNRIRTLASLYHQAGFRWSAFRLAYAFRLRTGLIRLQMPQYKWADRPLETWLRKGIPSTSEAYFQWRKQHSPKFFFDLSHAERSGNEDEAHWDKQTAIAEADRILNGEIKYFSHQFIKTGFPPNWQTDYVTLTLSDSEGEGSLPSQLGILRRSAAQNDMNKHWSQLSDDSSIDIKFIWEPNRFAFVYTLVRAYAATKDDKYADAFWTAVESWAEENPPNTGPNWMDGQEAALRLMAWVFGLYGFARSTASTPQRIAQLTVLVASHAERIYQNKSFAIFTHSNHAVTEALGLWMAGLLFPELKYSDRYLDFGYLSLEREARAQIFPDGTYSMYSLNYHRFILHIYLYAIQLGEVNHFPLSTQLRESVTKSITYLSRLIDPKTGQMPIYGSNDGALVLPLNNCDFTDYRPLLQLDWYITKGEWLFDAGEWDEDIFWLCGESLTAKNAKDAKKEEREKNLSALRVLGGESYPNGGVYLLRNTDSHALIRCTDFTSRPSHADQLHIDLWIRGHNIAVDAGTYLYSGEGIWRNGLAHTSAHNTVTVDNKDQMTMLSRFTWTNWSKGKVLKHDKNIWQGEHDGYKPVSHKRTVILLEGDRWLVIDHLVANEPHQYSLHWLLSDFPFEQKDNLVLLSLGEMKYMVQTGMVDGNGKFSLVRADPSSTRGWRSRYYGHKEPAISVMLEADSPQVTFWTFFGVEGDVLEIVGNTLKVNSTEIRLNPTNN